MEVDWREGCLEKLNMLVRSLPNWRAREILRVATLGLGLFAAVAEPEFEWASIPFKSPWYGARVGGCEAGAAEAMLVLGMKPIWRSLRPIELDLVLMFTALARSA